MQRAATTLALIILGCAACTAAEPPSTAPRLEEAQKLFEEGQSLRDAAKYAEAARLVERALELRESILGGTHPEVASCLSLLGDVHRLRGDDSRAEALLQRALAIQEAALGKTHPDIAFTLNTLANIYADRGLYTQAEAFYERALAIREAALGKNHPLFARSLRNLAMLYKDQGLYSRAEMLFEQALAIEETTLGKNHPDVSYSLNNLGALYTDQGLYARAEPLIERALAIREATFGKNHPRVASSLSTLALLYSLQGLHARAQPLFERALVIDEATFGKDHPAVANALDHLGASYDNQGLHAQAGPLYERALAIREAALGKNHPAVAASLLNLASLYASQGLHARAEPLSERALAIFEAALGKNHPHTVSALNFVAWLRLTQRSLVEALPIFTRAFAASEEHLRQEVFSFSEARLAGSLRLLRQDEERLYSLVREYPEEPRVLHLALSAALLRKGRSVEELANTSRIVSRSLGEADRSAFERLRALRTQFSTLSLSGPGSLSPADYQQRLDELASNADALEKDLSRRSAPLRALATRPPPSEVIPHVARTLPKGGALIEFIAYRDSPLALKPDTPPSQSPSQLRYLAFLLFADGRIHAVDLGPAEPIDTAALRLHDALSGQTVSYQPAAQTLYKLAFRPLLPHLGKARRLFVSPDGQLALIPFAALHDGKRFLVDTLDITYLTSGRDLLPRPEDISPAGSVVVLADPDFGSPPAAASSGAQAAPALTDRSASFERFVSSGLAPLADTPWPPLPGTRREAETIHRLFPRAQVLLGPAATKHVLLTLDTPGILHIATHGFFLEDAAAPAATTRAVNHFGAIGEAGPLQPPSDPLLRSGLILSGVGSQQAKSGQLRREDTLITALELAGLNLWGTQLVVLSACDTGRGDIKLGDGVYGLRRSFLVAGAETVVTSLWKVNDEVTQRLMERYYRHLLAGLGRTSALREAMRELRREHPHPHFWAAFTALGVDAPLQGLSLPTEVSPPAEN